MGPEHSGSEKRAEGSRQRQPSGTTPQPAGAPSQRDGAPALGPFFNIGQLVGNRAGGRLLQAKLRVSEPGDSFEQEADRVADQVMGSGAPARVAGRAGANRAQRACRGCEEEEGTRHGAGATLQRKESHGAGAPARATAVGPHVPPSHEGQPLAGSVRDFFEPRFGYDFGSVRVHTGARAAESARSVRARAYTVGSDIVFDEGQFAPHTDRGKRLLAHELAHTIQQGALGSSETVVMRDGDGQPAHDEPSGGRPSLPLPGTGLTFMPGPLTNRLLGQRLLFPSSLRVTNALDLTGAGAPGIPSFVLDLNSDLFMLSILQNIDLTTSNTPGTPPGREGEPYYQDHISFVNPRVFMNPRTGAIDGRAILSVPTGYPRSLRASNEFPVEFRSNDLTNFTGRVSYGPLHLDFNVSLHYDEHRLANAVRPAFDPAGGFEGFMDRLRGILRRHVPGVRLDSLASTFQTLIRSAMNHTLDSGGFVTEIMTLVGQSVPPGVSAADLRTALSGLANEITHPGFEARAVASVAGVPISYTSLSAPTTVPLPHPLYGAPTAYPSRSFMGGVILAPPGAITDIAVPAAGLTYSNYGRTSGTSLTAAALPTMSPTAISAHQPLARQFPVYAYAEVSHVRRITAGFDLGFRVTAQFSTADMAGPLPPLTDPVQNFMQMRQNYLDATSRTGAAPVPQIGAGIFGRFNGP